MSWQCSYCETVNQDATPICTVCERVAPVVESFLSLEQIHHAREYEELLSKVYSFEADCNYEKMLETALKAASTFNQNDVAISKIRLAVKLIYKEKIQDIVLINIKDLLKTNQYAKAHAYLQLWDSLKFNHDIISSYSDIVIEELEKIENRDSILKQVTQNILNETYSDALTIIETELLADTDCKELLELRTKVQNIIRSSDNKAKSRKIPKIYKPIKRETVIPELKDVDFSFSDDRKIKRRKFPKVKRK